MIFSKILQSLIFISISFYAGCPVIAALDAPLKLGATSKIDSTLSSDKKGEAAQKFDKSSKLEAKSPPKKGDEITLTGASRESIESEITEQLKKLAPVSTPTTAKKNLVVTPQVAEAQLSKKQGNLFVHIQSDKPIQSIASFAQNKNWYVVLAGVTDIKIAPYEQESIPNLDSVHVLKAPTGEAILKIGFKVHQTPTTLQTDKGLDLSFQAKYEPKTCNDLIQLPATPQSPYCIRMRFADAIIEFDDPVTHHSFWVLTSEKPFREIDEHKYPEFTLLTSNLGVAIDKISEDLEIDYRERKIFISSEFGLSISPVVSLEAGNKPQSIFTEFDSKVAPERISALTQLTSQANNETLQKNIELIWQYLGLGQVAEALSLINLLRENYPDIALIPTFRALEGLTQLLLNRTEKANELLKVLSYDPEAKFWYRLAEASANQFIDTDSLHNLVRYKDNFYLLPQALKARFQAIILQTAILHKECSVLKVFADKTLYPEDLFLQQLFKLATALITLDAGKKEVAIPQLTALAHSFVSQRVATVAAFELIKIAEQDKTITPQESLAKLNQLRFTWRGDLLEYTISRYYVTRLGDNKFYAKTLPILRSLIKYFPEQAHFDKLPELMQKNLMDFFEQKPSPSLMESLSVFQEFGDLAPNNTQGDQIILKAIGELVQLDLYHDALDILKKYTNKKMWKEQVTANRKNMFLYKIAVVELLAKETKDCLKTLGEIKDPAPEIVDEMAVLKAEALRQNNEVEAAIDSLGATPLQVEKKAELYFAGEKWPEAAEYYQKAIALLPEADKENQAKCVANLALCYGLLKNKVKLAELKEAYGKLMQESTYKDMFHFLITDTAFNGALTSTEFGKIDSFADNLKKVFKGSGKAGG